MKRIKMPKIFISIPSVLLLASLYALDFGKVFLPTFAAIFIHEISHIIAVRICGGSIASIDIRAFGIRVDVPELKLMSYKREIIIAAAGPLAGILTAGITSATAKLFGIMNLNYFIGINLVVSAINLIPVYPLDGGRIIISATLSLFSVKCAYIISKTLSFVAVVGLFFLCGICAFYGNLNPSLVIFSLYIAVCGIKFRSPF